jgi:C_GCAxxG_C_C family probable redox protein
VVFALQRHLEIGNRDVFKSMSALSGGIIGKGTHICGALVGGLAIIGLVFGRADFLEPGSPREGGPSNFTRTRDLGDELYREFEKEYKSVICQEIQKRHFGWCPYPVDHSDPFHEQLHESGEIFDILSTYASKVVVTAAEITARIVLREWHKQKVA